MREQMDRLLLAVAALIFLVAAALPFAAANWPRWALFALVMTASALGAVGTIRAHRRLCALLGTVEEEAS